MTDDELVEGCRQGSREHFSELYDRFAPAMYGICLRYSGSVPEAKDVLQESFIKVFERLKEFEVGRAALGAWIRTIVVHTAVDYYRKRTMALNLFPFDIRPNGSAVYEEDEVLPIDYLQHEQLLEIIRQLPVGYRTVFNLHVIEEKTHKEIAELLGFAESTLRTQFIKAKNMLQERIKHYLGIIEI